MNTPEAVAPPALPRSHAWALALIATLTMAVSYVDRQALAAIAPAVTKEFNISEPQYGLLVSAFSFAYLAGAPVAGFLIDRVGARRGLLGAVLLWSLVAASHSLVPGFAALFVLRLALGVAESPSFPGAAQTIQRALPPADRARGFGILFTGSSLGAMLAGPLATSIDKHWGFRAAFLGTAAVGLAWVPLWLSFAWRRRAREALDHQAADAPSASKRPSPLSVALHPAVLRATLAILATAPRLGFMLNWSSKYLVADHGLKLADAGPYLIIPPLVFDAGSILFGHFASVRARHRPGNAPDRLLFFIAMLFFLSFALAPFGETPLQSMLLGGAGMAGGGGVFALVTADMLARVPPNTVGSAAGAAAAAQSIAYIVMAPLLGLLIKASGGYTIPFIAVGLWVIPGCVAWLAWPPPPPQRELDEQ